MKLVVKRNTRFGQNTDSPEQSIRIALAHVSHHVWVKGIDASKEGATDIITVQWEKQPGSDDVDFDAVIRDAIGLSANLEIISLDAAPNTISVSGLRLLSSNDGVHTYDVLPLFAKTMAEKLDFCARVKNSSVADVTFGFKETADGYRYTGEITLTSTSQAPSRENAYNTLATIIMLNPETRDAIIDKSFKSMTFTNQDNGTSSINMRHSAPEKQATATP